MIIFSKKFFLRTFLLTTGSIAPPFVHRKYSNRSHKYFLNVRDKLFLKLQKGLLFLFILLVLVMFLLRLIIIIIITIIIMIIIIIIVIIIYHDDENCRLFIFYFLWSK
jgi:tryptophan-rich sensory protein